MIVVFQASATEPQIQDVIARIDQAELRVHRSDGTTHTIVGIVGDRTRIDPAALGAMPGVRDVIPVSTPYKLASRELHPDDTVVEVGGARAGRVAVGGLDVVVIAGPCSVESAAQIDATARHVKDCGVQVLRGGAFKPRTSPYAFQGLGEPGLKLLREAAERHGLPVVTEVMTIEQIPLVAEYADWLQVGARNMQNFPLLTELGKVHRPVLLKRGAGSTIQEWLMSAEYVLSAGNPDVVLCERGIRTFEPMTRSTLDLSAVPVVKQLSHLPVVVDPSHCVGDRRFVAAMARAAVAAGADGIIVEVHPDPDRALSDGPQSLTHEQFQALMNRCRVIASTLGRRIPREVRP